MSDKLQLVVSGFTFKSPKVNGAERRLNLARRFNAGVRLDETALRRVATIDAHLKRLYLRGYRDAHVPDVAVPGLQRPG